MNTEGHRSEGTAEKAGGSQRVKDSQKSVFNCAYLGLLFLHEIQLPDSGLFRLTERPGPVTCL